MNQVFNSIDLRRKIFNLKTNSIKQQTKKNYDIVLLEFQTNLNNMYDIREETYFSGIEEHTVKNFTRNEYFNSLIQGLSEDIYFSMCYWLLEEIKHYNDSYIWNGNKYYYTYSVEEKKYIEIMD